MPNMINSGAKWGFLNGKQKDMALKGTKTNRIRHFVLRNMIVTQKKNTTKSESKIETP